MIKSRRDKVCEVIKFPRIYGQSLRAIAIPFIYLICILSLRIKVLQSAEHEFLPVRISVYISKRISDHLPATILFSIEAFNVYFDRTFYTRVKHTLSSKANESKMIVVALHIDDAVMRAP